MISSKEISPIKKFYKDEIEQILDLRRIAFTGLTNVDDPMSWFFFKRITSREQNFELLANDADYDLTIINTWAFD